MRHVLVLALVLAGCHKKKDAEHGPDVPAAAASTAPAAAAGTTKQMSPSTDVTGLVAKLRYEAAHRPTGTVTAEQVFAALDKAGLPLGKQRQYAGFTVNAAYCAGGTTASGVPVSICEYPDAAAAANGKAFLDKELAMKGARALKGSTVINAGVGPSPDVDKAINVFNTL